MKKYLEAMFVNYFGEKLAPRIKDAFIHGGIASILGRGFPIFSLMICAKLLSPELFGKFMLIYGFVIAFAMIVEAGLAVTITKFTAQYKNYSMLRVSEILSIAQYISVINVILVSLIVLTFKDEIANIILADASLQSHLGVSSVIIAISGLCSIQQAILYGLEKYKQVKNTNFISGTVVLFALPFGAHTNEINGMLIALLITQIIKLVIQVFYTSRFFSAFNIPRFGMIKRSDIAMVYGFSFPSFLNGLLFGPSILFAMSLIAHEYNGHYEIGVYNAAYQWFSLVLFLPSVFTQTALPIMSEQVNLGDVRMAAKLLFDKIQFIVFIMLPIILIFMIFSPVIMSFYGDIYKDSWPILAFLMAAAIVALPQGLMGNYIVSNDKPWLWFVTSILWALSLILITYLLAGMGALAIVIGLIVAYLLKFISAMYFINKLCNT